MLLSVSWLRQFCNPDISDAELGDVLTMAGLELEEMQGMAPPFSGVLVAEIKQCEQHPDADRLRVCQVDAGTGELLQIVCGAPNARVGIKVPLATVGALLPPDAEGKPFKIKKGKLRGVESLGMLCSAKELGIDADASGLLELPADAPVGMDIREYLQLNEQVMEIKLTPNLGHCLSVRGVARELAAHTGSPLLPAATAWQRAVPAQSIADTLPVQVQAPDLCGRFAGRVVRGVNAQAQTPDWMLRQLKACGQRPVNVLVDISNYVMFEIGQPSHMFDLDKIKGGLAVRWAQEGESLKLLNEQTVTLDSQVGVILDENGPQSLAGVMGGDASAVSDGTQNIFIEAAFWWPDAIAGRARRFNFTTDAGHRYERGVDFELPPQAVQRITELVLQICGGQAGPLQDEIVALPQRPAISMRLSRAQQVIGMPVSAEQCEQAFARLGLPFKREGDVFSVQPPSYRFDLEIEADLIEEVLRMQGLDSLPLHPPKAFSRARVGSESQRSRTALKQHMVERGYQEVVAYSFIDAQDEAQLHGLAEPVRLLNPIASQMSVMRSGLLASLVDILQRNLGRNKASVVRLFEWGRVFAKDSSQAGSFADVAGVAQPLKLGALAYGWAEPQQWAHSPARKVDFYDVKADVQSLLPAARFSPFAPEAQHPALHPGRSAQVWLGDVAVGYVGELHPKWVQAYELPSAPVVFELDGASLQAAALPQAQALSRYQGTERDLSVVLPEATSHTDIMAAVESAKTRFVQSALLYDIYRPQKEGGSMAMDEKSVTIGLSLSSMEATLTEEQIEADRLAVLAALEGQLGARLR